MKFSEFLVWKFTILLSLALSAHHAYVLVPVTPGSETSNNATTPAVATPPLNAQIVNTTGGITEAELENVANEIIQKFYSGLQAQDQDNGIVNSTGEMQVSNDHSGIKRQKLRVLAPIDLTKQFTFDDEEEMTTANYSHAEMENMKLQIESIFRTEADTTTNSSAEELEPPVAVTEGYIAYTTTTTERPTLFQSLKSKVDKGVSFFGGLVKKPFEIVGLIRPSTSPQAIIPVEVTEQPVKIAPISTQSRPQVSTAINSTTRPIGAQISTNVVPVRLPTSAQIPDNRIIFSDDDDEMMTTSPFKRDTKDNDTSTGDIVFAQEKPPGSAITPPDTPEPPCRPHEIVYNFQCELLFSKGPCDNGHALVENETTGQVNCQKFPCPDFPQNVLYNGKCVMQSYFTGCPGGMHLIVERSGMGYCDCKPGFLYSDKMDKCFEAYTRGPCQPSEYFVLGTNMQPECVANPCRTSGYVCHGSELDCAQNLKRENCVRLQSFCQNGDGVFLVNPKTLRPECLSMMSLQSSLEERILSNVGQFSCSPGTKRDITGKCRRSIRFTFS